jgi:hypothetical protein
MTTIDQAAAEARRQMEQKVDAALKRLDPDLRLDFEIDEKHGVIYKVVHATPDGDVTAVVWQNGDGTPKPLGPELVAQVKRQENAMAGVVPAILRAQQVRRASLRADSGRHYDAIVAKHLPRIVAAYERELARRPVARVGALVARFGRSVRSSRRRGTAARARGDGPPLPDAADAAFVFAGAF